VWWLATMTERFTKWFKCKLVMPNVHLLQFKQFGLDLPGHGISSDDYKDKLRQGNVGSVDPDFRAGIFGRWLGETLNGEWLSYNSAQVEAFQDLAGCWSPFDNTVWNMFEHLMASYRKPFSQNYVGLHVPHSDKAKEGVTANLSTVMQSVKAHPQWAALERLFLATDNVTVLQQEISSVEKEGFSFHWTKYERHVGGEPDSCTEGVCHHDNDSTASIKAVLNDTLSLAHASVMVGSFNSNFFRLPWLLNYLRRSPEERAQPWCWDTFTGQPCHDRRKFVARFVRTAREGGERFLPEHDEALASCKPPLAISGSLPGRHPSATPVVASYDDMMHELKFK